MHLDDMVNLPKGWDGYDADPISAETVAKVKATFPTLPPGWWDCVPMSSGGVQIEQHAGGWDIEISIERARPSQSDAGVKQKHPFKTCVHGHNWNTGRCPHCDAAKPA